jgi:hypothetical protein
MTGDWRRHPMDTRNRKSWRCLTRSNDKPGAPSRLAHWPPPFRLGAEKHSPVRYIADEEREETRATGFRITRGILSDD